MKKTILIMVSLLAFSIAFAEENETEVIDQETQDEIKAFDLPQGIELRIEMLKEAILERIAFGEEAINRTLEFNSSIDVTNLTAIIVELKILLNETELINKENVTSAVADFVAIKKDAIDLVSEFKRIAWGMLNEQRRSQIKEQIRERVAERINATVQRINLIKKAYKNAYSRQIMSHLNYTNSELVEQFQNGTITADQLKEELKNYYNSLDNETKTEIKESLIEAKEILKNKIAVRVQNVVQNAFNNTINRLTQRAQKLEELNISSSRIQANIEDRLNRTQNLRDRLVSAITSRLGNGDDRQ